MIQGVGFFGPVVITLCQLLGSFQKTRRFVPPGLRPISREQRKERIQYLSKTLSPPGSLEKVLATFDDVDFSGFDTHMTSSASAVDVIREPGAGWVSISHITTARLRSSRLSKIAMDGNLEKEIPEENVNDETALPAAVRAHLEVLDMVTCPTSVRLFNPRPPFAPGELGESVDESTLPQLVTAHLDFLDRVHSPKWSKQVSPEVHAVETTIHGIRGPQEDMVEATSHGALEKSIGSASI